MYQKIQEGKSTASEVSKTYVCNTCHAHELRSPPQIVIYDAIVK